MVSMADMLVGTVVLLVCAIAAITMISLMNQIQANPTFNSKIPSQGKNSLNLVKSSLYVFDYGGAFLLFAITGISAIAGTMIRSKPIFFALSLITMTIFVIISTMFTLTYKTLASQQFFAAVANNFPWTLLAFQYLPIIGLAGLAITAIATYGKTSL